VRITRSLGRLAILIAFLAAALTPAPGAPRHSAPKKPEAPAKIVIIHIAPGSITYSDGNFTKTLTVTQFTEITVDGRRATLAELKERMPVEVALRDATTASRITATSALQETEPPKKK
jgi:hypothetical protein